MLLFNMTFENEIRVKRPIDDELILRIAEGDREALSLLYEAMSRGIYGFALSITKNSHDADDVMQETFIKVYEKAQDYKPQGKASAWVYTVAKNLATDKLRHKSRIADYEEGFDGIDFSTVSNAENKLLIENLFKLLNEEEKQIIMLHAVSEMKFQEISRVLGLTLGTTLSKYHRAIKRLKSVLKEEI